MPVRYDTTGSSCARGPQTGTKLLLEEIRRRFPGSTSAGIYNCRNVRGGRSLSLHAEGRAVDIRPATKEQGDQIAAWARTNSTDWKIQEVIWYRRIWTSSKDSAGWRAYSGTNPHTDHIHIGQNRAGASLTKSPGGAARARSTWIEFP